MTATGEARWLDLGAVAVVDAGIRVVEGRHGELDSVVFDAQTVRDLGDFLRQARDGRLTAEEVVQEAVIWQRVLEMDGPRDTADAAPLRRAVDLLARLPTEGTDPATPVEPANDLERAMQAAVEDERGRPALWRAIFDGDIVLPVVAYELVRPEGANYQFLTLPGAPMVVGFAAEERLDALLPEGARMSRVLAPGRDLAKLSPAGHWLLLNPSHANSVLLSPWEVAGLPDGARMDLPNPDALQVEPPNAHDERFEQVSCATATIPDVEQVWWARVRSRNASSDTPWRDVLTVAATSPGGEPAAVSALSAALRSGGLAQAVVVGRQVDLAHPFIEAVVATGRPAFARREGGDGRTPEPGRGA